MKTYLVGGAIRDKLLNLPINDRDYVVVGATADQLLNMGYTQINKHCPVFLHPQTHDEYALARTEVKSSAGHDGFVFDASQNITIEMDLKRRDLTINAIAEDQNGQLIDPYHGIKDIENKILKHVSPAFIEDPMRLLRISRFMARYAPLGFCIAAETNILLKEIVKNGELSTIPKECIWIEMEKALAEQQPEAFFESLLHCGALPLLFPHLKFDAHILQALKITSAQTKDPMIRFAVLIFMQLDNVQDANIIKQTISTLCHQLNVPKKYRELSLTLALNYQDAINAPSLPAENLLKFFTNLKVQHYRLFESQNCLEKLLTACQAIAQSKQIHFDPASLRKCAVSLQSCSFKDLKNEKIKRCVMKIKVKERHLDIIETWRKQHFSTASILSPSNIKN